MKQVFTAIATSAAAVSCRARSEPRSGRKETDSTLIENVNIFDGTKDTLIEGNKIA